jgi:hypothetical protein
MVIGMPRQTGGNSALKDHMNVSREVPVQQCMSPQSTICILLRISTLVCFVHWRLSIHKRLELGGRADRCFNLLTCDHILPSIPLSRRRVRLSGFDIDDAFYLIDGRVQPLSTCRASAVHVLRQLPRSPAVVLTDRLLS